jgi:hypothetical protein
MTTQDENGQESQELTAPTSTFNRVWSQAFIELFSNDPSNYTKIYSSYMQVEAQPPTTDSVALYTGNEWVDYSVLPPDSPIKNGVIRIGTYLHAPYAYINSDGKLIGFEVEIAEQIVAKINAHYSAENAANNVKNLEIEWVYVSLDDSVMLWDGSDNEAISAQLEGGLRTPEEPKDYDMVFSGIMTRGADNFECTFPNAYFYISALYTGMDDFTGAPTNGNLDDIGRWLANCSKIIGEEITITNTNHLKGVNIMGSQQQQGADLIIEAIKKHGGQAVSNRRLIPGLMDAINYKTVHVYCGDLIQIQFATAFSNHPVDLDVQLLPEEAKTLSAYTALNL